MWMSGTAADYLDLLDKLNDFLTLKGSAFGLSYAGTGNGTFTAYSGGASSVAETFTITATSATNWTVVGSVSGSIGPATTGTPFAHAKLAFTITAGGTAFVAGDLDRAEVDQSTKGQGVRDQRLGSSDRSAGRPERRRREARVHLEHVAVGCSRDRTGLLDSV